MIEEQIIHRVKIGDYVRMVRHMQEPATERPEGPYKVTNIRVMWIISGRHDGFQDIFFELTHPDGWSEWRPNYLCVPVNE